MHKNISGVLRMIIVYVVVFTVLVNMFSVQGGAYTWAEDDPTSGAEPIVVSDTSIEASTQVEEAVTTEEVPEEPMESSDENADQSLVTLEGTVDSIELLESFGLEVEEGDDQLLLVSTDDQSPSETTDEIMLAAEDTSFIFRHYGLELNPREAIENEADIQSHPYLYIVDDTYPKRTLIPEFKWEKYALDSAVYTPIDIAKVSFNVDVIAEGDITSRPSLPEPTQQAMFTTTRVLENTTDTSLRTVLAAQSFRGEYNATYEMYEERLNLQLDHQLLPDDGFLELRNSSRFEFQLEPYDEFNAIMITEDDAALHAATITFDQPQAYSTLAFLTIGTGVSVLLDIEYSDGTLIEDYAYTFNGLANNPIKSTENSYPASKFSFGYNMLAPSSLGDYIYSNFVVAYQPFTYSTSVAERKLMSELNQTIVFPDVVRNGDEYINPDLDGIFYHTLAPNYLDMQYLLPNGDGTYDQTNLYKPIKSITIKNPDFATANPGAEYNNIVILAVSGHSLSLGAPSVSTVTEDATSYSAVVKIISSIADGYVIDIATDSGFSQMVDGYDGRYEKVSDPDDIVSLYTVSGLLASTTYYVRAKRVVDGAMSSYSSTASFTTKSGAYHVLYDGNGMTGGTLPVDVSTYPDFSDAYIIDAGEDPPVYVDGGLTFVFNGWNTATDGSGTTYQPGDTIAIGTADVTLYVLWELEGGPLGSGALSDPYLVMDSDDLLWIDAALDTGLTHFDGKYFKQMRDIDLVSIDWTYLGSSGNYFSGQYDGQGFSIKNLTINKVVDKYAQVGFFYEVRGASLENMIFEHAQISISVTDSNKLYSTDFDYSMAAFLAVMSSDTSFTKILIDENSSMEVVDSGQAEVGGMVARSTGGGGNTFDACGVEADITFHYFHGGIGDRLFLSTYSGGFIGDSYLADTIDRSYFSGNISVVYKLVENYPTPVTGNNSPKISPFYNDYSTVDGSVTSSYWDGSISFENSVSNLTVSPIYNFPDPANYDPYTVASVTNAIFDRPHELSHEDLMLLSSYQSITGFDTSQWIFAADQLPTIDMPVTEISIESIGLPDDETDITLLPSETEQLHPYALPVYVSTTYTYFSDNEGVASVSPSGLITAVAPGQAQISVVSNLGGLIATCDVTVEGIRVSSVEISPASATMDVGDTLDFDAVIEPVDASVTTHSWRSTNPGVASVDENGLVTALFPGTATIIVTTLQGAKKDTALVTVTPVLLGDILLDQTEVSLNAGYGVYESQQVNVTYVSSVPGTAASYNRIRWTSDDPSVATVDNNGVIRASGAGSTFIRAATIDGSNIEKTVSVSVVATGVTGIQATVEAHLDMLVEINQKTLLPVQVLPQEAVNRAVRWTSSDPEIIAVDQGGWITPLAAGQATITATTVEGGYEVAFNITTKVTELGIRIANKGMFFNVARTKERLIEVEVDPAETDFPEYVFASSDTSVATVDDDGIVTALGNGYTTITVRSVNRGLTDHAFMKVVDFSEGEIVVYDAQDGQPLEGVTVNVEGDEYTTDASGTVAVKYTRESISSLFRIEMEGYRTKERAHASFQSGLFSTYLKLDDGEPYVMYAGISNDDIGIVDVLETNGVLDYKDYVELTVRMNWQDEEPGDVYFTNGSRRVRLARNPYGYYRTGDKQFFYDLLLSKSEEELPEGSITIDKTFRVKFNDKDNLKQVYSQDVNLGYIRGDTTFDDQGYDNTEVNINEADSDLFDAPFSMALPENLPVQMTIEGDRIYVSLAYDASWSKSGEAGSSFERDPSAMDQAMAIKETITKGTLSEGVKKLMTPSSFQLEKSYNTSISVFAYMEARLKPVTRLVAIEDLSITDAFALGINRDMYRLLEASAVGKIPVTTYDVDFISSGIMLTAKGEMVYSQYYMAGIVPVNVKMKFGAELTSVNKFMTDEDGDLDYSGSFTVMPFMGAYAGVGIEGIASVGVNLDGTMPIVMSYPSPVTMTIDLTMDLSIVLEFLFYSKTFDIYSDQWNLLNETLSSSSSNPAVSMSSALTNPNVTALEMLGRDYVDYEDNPKGIDHTQVTPIKDLYDFDVTSGFNQLDPKVTVFDDGKMLMLWLDDDTSRNLVNRTVLYYALYDGNAWSDPLALEDDGTPDGAYDVVVDGNTAYIVYTDGQSILNYDADNPDDPANASIIDLTGNMAISYATISSGGVVNLLGYLSEEILAADRANMLPSLMVNDSVVEGVWLRNNANDIFGMIGTNALVASQHHEGEPASEEVLFETDKKILSYDVLDYRGERLLVYVLDEDDSYLTDDDRSLYLLKGDGTSVQLGDTGMIAAPKLAMVDYQPSLYWYEDGQIKYLENIYKDDVKVLLEDQGIYFTNDYQILTNEDGQVSLVYKAGDMEPTQNVDDPYKQVDVIKYLHYNQATGAWDAYQSEFLRSEEKISSFYADMTSEGYLAVAYAQKLEVEGASDSYWIGDLNLMVALPAVNLSVENQEIIADDSSVMGGYETTLKLYVVNSGDRIAEGLEVQLLTSDDHLIDTYTYPEVYLSPGDEAVVLVFNYQVPSPLTEHEIKALVMPMNGATEGDLSDNAGSVILGAVDLVIEDARTYHNKDLYVYNAGLYNMSMMEATGVEINVYETDSDGDKIGAPVKTLSLDDMALYTSVGYEIRIDASEIDFDGAQEKIYLIEATSNQAENRTFNNRDYMIIPNLMATVMPYDVSISNSVVEETASTYMVGLTNRYTQDSTATLTLSAYDDSYTLLYSDTIDYLIEGEESAFIAMEILSEDYEGTINLVQVEVTGSSVSGLTMEGQAYYSNIAVENVVDLALDSDPTIIDIQLTGIEETLEFNQSEMSYQVVYDPDTETEIQLSVETTSDMTLVTYVYGEIEGEIVSGLASEVLSLVPGTIEITTQAEDGSQVEYSIELSDKPFSTASSGTTATVVTPQPTGLLDVYFDGDNTTPIGLVTLEEESDLFIAKISFDQENMKELLEVAQEKVTLALDQKIDVIEVALTGDMVRRAEDKEISYEIKTELGTYLIPAEAIKIAQVQQQLGKDVPYEDMIISIEIKDVSKEMSDLIEELERQGQVVFVSPQISYEVKADYGETSVAVNRFDHYVDRKILLPEGVDPSKITTGVLMDAAGKIVHVPTKVYEENGRWYASINSLSNSSYSVVYHPVEVTAVKDHWFMEAVNNLASRYIIQEIDTFNPNAPISRGMYAAYISRALGIYGNINNVSDYFSDINPGDALADAIAASVERGIIQGYPDGTYKADALISREEAMVMFSRAMKVVDLVNEDDLRIASYKDYELFSSWALDGARQAVGSGIFNGTSSTTLSPHGTFTYGEAAKAIENLLLQANIIN